MQEEKQRKGPWTEEEDERLAAFVKFLGERKWDMIAKESGLRRSGKSCRMRWLNYLSPTIKRGNISAEEEQTIVQLQQQWGNKWSKIAQKLPGRTDNEIKNYWRTYLKKKVQAQEEVSKINKKEQDDMFQTKNSTMQGCDIAEMEAPKDTILCSDTVLEDLSNLAYPTSPFEIRLLDWMSELADFQTIANGNCDFDETNWCYMACKYEDNCNAMILDSSFSLWDANL